MTGAARTPKCARSTSPCRIVSLAGGTGPWFPPPAGSASPAPLLLEDDFLEIPVADDLSNVAALDQRLQLLLLGSDQLLGDGVERFRRSIECGPVLQLDEDDQIPVILVAGVSVQDLVGHDQILFLRLIHHLLPAASKVSQILLVHPVLDSDE